MEQRVYEVKLENAEPMLLRYWQSGNDAAVEGCDACIGYSVYHKDDLSEIDGGEMDYAEKDKNYKSLDDALDDVLDFAFDGRPVESTALSDIDPDELED